MVERTNALEPDLIVITGDIFDFDPAFIEDGAAPAGAGCARAAASTRSSATTTSTPALERVVERLRALAPGIRLLRDEIVRAAARRSRSISPASRIRGRTGRRGGSSCPRSSDSAAERPGDGPTLLLVHRPEAFPQAARLGFPLVLAGHTHGGQLALPTAGRALEPGADRHALHARPLPAGRARRST